MAAWFAFDVGVGVQGLWVGFSLGYLPAAIIYAIILQGIDWGQVIE